MNLARAGDGAYRIDSFGGGVVAGFSGRVFDNSRRKEFLAELGLDPEDLLMVKQVHGNKVIAADGLDPKLEEKPADGLVTDRKGIVLGVRTADCVPVFFHDPVRKAVGIAHGGWRGIKEGILERMLAMFSFRFRVRAQNLKVAFGPSIRTCCYEVGSEFKGYFPDFYRPRTGVKGNVNLIAAARRQLITWGVRPENIYDTQLCTVCRNDLFYSHRVEKQTPERILNVISLVG